MQKLCFLFISIGFSLFSLAQQIQVGKDFTISTEPADADLYIYNGPGRTDAQLIEEAFLNDPATLPYLQKLGNATYTLEIKDYDDDQVKLIAVGEGYKPSVVSYVYNKDIKKQVLNLSQKLSTRVFQLDAEPYDAVIKVDGEAIPKPYPFYLELPENTSKTVEVTKTGFLTHKELFYNVPGKPEAPRDIKTIVLQNRVVQLLAEPAEGSFITVNGAALGEGDAQIVVPYGECTTVKIKKEGFVEKELTYCNKNGSPLPPVNDRVQLIDREVAIRVPDGAVIRINGKEVGKSEYTLKISKGSSAKLEVEKPGFVTYLTTLHNTDEEVAPPPFIALTEGSNEFPEDESFTASSESDIANTDFVLTVPSHLSENQAWSIVAQIVQAYFDELEQIDQTTGYLRSAWVYKRYASRAVRTRVIVKMNNRNPLKYSIKISSEENNDPLTLDSRDDDDYKAWDRVLNQYKEIVSEAQARLK